MLKQRFASCGQFVCFYILLTYSSFLEAGGANFTIKLNTELAQKVLETVCSKSEVDVEFFKASQEISDMLRHFSQFRDYFTFDNYIDALENAAQCKAPQKDYFRFKQVIAERTAIQAELNALNRHVDKAIQSILSAYTPASVKGTFKAVVMVGTPSCGGWSASDSFYVDLPCIQNDKQGLLYLIAHETYHLLQDEFMPKASKTDYVEQFLYEMIREGSATVIADMKKVQKPGHYTRLSVASLKKNDRRATTNRYLFKLLLQALHNESSESDWRQVYDIGFSGNYDAPMYSVGAEMTRAVISEVGVEQWLLWLKTEPVLVVREFARLKKLSWLTQKLAVKREN